MTAKSVLLALAPLKTVIVVVDGHPTGTVFLDGEVYAERTSCPEPFLGFYDWLRTYAGSVVGLRLTIGEQAQDLAKLLPHRSYIVRDGYVVTILWGPADAAIDEEASAEQDFGASRAFVGEQGNLLLAFDAEGLTLDELEALQLPAKV